MKKVTPWRVSQRELIARRKRRRVFFGFFLCLFILAFLIYFFFFSSFWKIKELEISSGKFLQKEELKEAIENFLAKERFLKFFPKNFLFLSQKDLSFLLEAFPALKTYQLKKDFSQRKISLLFEEREIMGVYCQFQKDFKECFYFDPDGRIFSLAPEVSGGLLFYLERKEPPYQKIGDFLLPPFDFSSLLKIKKLLEEKERIVTGLLSEKEIVFELSSGTKIYFNSSEISLTLLALENFLKQFPLNNWQYLDFRYLPNIYFRSFSNH